MSSPLAPHSSPPPIRPHEKGLYRLVQACSSALTKIFRRIFNLFSQRTPLEPPSLRIHKITIPQDHDGSATPSSHASSVTASPESDEKSFKLESIATKKLLPGLALERGRSLVFKESKEQNLAIHDPQFLIHLTRSQMTDTEFKNCLSFYIKEGQAHTPNLFHATLRNLLTYDTPYRESVHQAFLAFFTHLSPDEQQAFIQELISRPVNFDQRALKQKEISCFERCLNSLKFETKQTKYEFEKSLARKLHPELAPLLRALETGDLTGQKTSQLLRHIATLQNFPNLQEAIFDKLSFVDLQHILHNFSSSSHRDDNFDPLTLELVDALKQARVDKSLPLPEDATLVDDLISSEDLLSLFKKLPDMSVGFSQIFFSLSKKKQDELIELIKNDSPLSIFKFESMILKLFTGSQEQKKRLEKALLAKFHPEIKEPIKTVDKLILVLNKAVNYKEIQKEALATLTKDDFESLIMPLEGSHHGLINTSFIEALFKKCGETGLNQFFQKILSSHGGELTADEKKAISRLFSLKYSIYKFLASKKENPTLALYALNQLASSMTDSPISRAEEIRLAKEALTYARNNHIAISVVDIPSRLADERELLQDTVSITMLNECFKRVKNPQHLFPEYASLAGVALVNSDSLAFLKACLDQMPDFGMLKASLQTQKRQIQDSIPKKTATVATRFAHYEEFDPSVQRTLDPIRQKAVGPSEYAKYASYKLGQIEAMLDFLDAAENLKRNPLKKDFEISSLCENPDMEDSIAFPYDADYLVLGCYMYGGDFFTKVFMDKPEHRLDSLYSDFSSSGVRSIAHEFVELFGNIAVKRYAGWRKPADYKEPKILKLARFSPEIARRALKDRLLAKEEFFEACIYNDGSKMMINKDLIETLSAQEALELADYLREHHINIFELLINQTAKAQLLLDKGLITKAEFFSLILRKQGSAWIIDEHQISHLSKDDLNALVALIPKERPNVIAIARKSPTLSLHLLTSHFRYKGSLLGDNQFSKNDFFDSIIFKNDSEKTILQDSILQKLSKDDLYDLLQYAQSKKLSLEELKPLADVKLGLSALFIPQESGALILNEEILAKADEEESLTRLVSYLEIFHIDNSQAIFAAKDRLNLSCFAKGDLNGKALLNAAFYDNHLNKKLIANMSLSDLTHLKAHVVKLKSPEAIEFVDTILEAKSS